MNSQRSLRLALVFLCFLCTACGSKRPMIPAHQTAATHDLVQGNAWYMRGCNDKAAQWFEKALERFSASDDQDGVAKSLNNLGSLYRVRKDPQTALQFFDASERTFQSIGNIRGQITALSNTAAAYIDMNRLGEAETALDKADALALAQTVTHVPLFSNRILLEMKQNRPEAARPLMDKALAAVSKSSAFESATVYHVAGLLMEELGDHDKALTYYTRALETDRTGNFMGGMADDLTALGRVYQSMGYHEKAVDAFYRCLKIQTLLRDVEDVQGTSSRLKISLEALGKKAPDMRIIDVYLKRWADGEVDVSPCD